MHERRHQKLSVWRKHTLCLWVYDVTKTFPADEKFGLISQMRAPRRASPTGTSRNVKASKRKKHFSLEWPCVPRRASLLVYLSKDLHDMTEAQFADRCRIQSDHQADEIPGIPQDSIRSSIPQRWCSRQKPFSL